MIRNYLKTALRSLWRNRTYGLLNIVGLAVGITCATLILLWVEDEVTANHNHEKRDRLYAVLNTQTYDGTTYTFWATPGQMGPALKAEVPGIRNTARTYWYTANLFTLNKGGEQKNIYESGNYVDPSFFDMLSFHWLKGNPKNLMPNLYSIVISERMARKFFGDEDPMGQVLQMNHTDGYTVTGVFADQPLNSSFRSDWYTPIEKLVQETPWIREQWGSNGVQTLVELEPNARLEEVNRKVYGFISSKEAEARSNSFLFNMNQWRLYSKFTNGKQDGGRIVYVRLFTIVACFILLIACINFMNLATARSEKRAREVGMRKVLGGTKGMLIGQFLGESILLAMLSVLLSVGLTYVSMPLFNDLVEKKLGLDLLSPLHTAGLIAIGLVTGLLAGSYPSFYLSSFAPVAVLKGLRLKTDAGAGFVRKGLVVFQFSISIILIVGTVIVHQQIQHVQSRQLGYDKENLIMLTLDDNTPSHIDAIRNELKASGVVEEAGMSSADVLGIHGNGGGYMWPGKDLSKDVLITQEYTDANYLPAVGLPIVQGRNFRSDIASDSGNIIINETFARMLKGNPVGQIISREEGERQTVVGVVKDFIFNDFYKNPDPLIIYAAPQYAKNMTIRLKRTDNLQASLAKVGSVMKKVNPGYPFEYKFVDEEFARNFKAETLIGKLAGVFAVLAIVISCLGLFGLAAYTAERRTREIGIRKVLGASMQSVVQLLSKDFLQLVSISCLVAFPLAWWAASTWLAEYAYRTSIHWWVFGLAGLGALLIALGTVSFQAIRAALANPVKSLRTE